MNMKQFISTLRVLYTTEENQPSIYHLDLTVHVSNTLVIYITRESINGKIRIEIDGNRLVIHRYDYQSALNKINRIADQYHKREALYG